MWVRVEDTDIKTSGCLIWFILSYISSLNSSPPVLVIATNGGTLYHCVVLSRGGGNGDNVNEDDDAASQGSDSIDGLILKMV